MQSRKSTGERWQPPPALGEDSEARSRTGLAQARTAGAERGWVLRSQAVRWAMFPQMHWIPRVSFPGVGTIAPKEVLAHSGC